MKITSLVLISLYVTKLVAQKEIRTYGCVNLTKPKERFENYKNSINIEGALGFYLGNLKLTNNYKIGFEPIGKLKWYSMENKNIVQTDYSLSVSEIGARVYPFIIGDGILRKITKSLYVDVSYSKIKLVNVNIWIDEVVKTMSYGYGINFPIYDMSDLGIESELTLTAGVHQYSWVTPARAKSSFAGRQIGLSFAVKLGGQNKR